MYPGDASESAELPAGDTHLREACSVSGHLFSSASVLVTVVSMRLSFSELQVPHAASCGSSGNLFPFRFSFPLSPPSLEEFRAGGEICQNGRKGQDQGGSTFRFHSLLFHTVPVLPLRELAATVGSEEAGARERAPGSPPVRALVFLSVLASDPPSPCASILCCAVQQAARQAGLLVRTEP